MVKKYDWSKHEEIRRWNRRMKMMARALGALMLVVLVVAWIWRPTFS
jgi:hypothetical protein